MANTTVSNPYTFSITEDISFNATCTSESTNITITVGNYYRQLSHGTIAVYDDAIKLPKIGKVKAVIHREIPDDYKLKRAIVSQNSDGTYHCSLVYEFDKNIIQTNILNHSKYASEDKFILGDVTQQETKDKIFEACGDKKIDVILGGPPCQGFSYAGWRDPEDKRNQLFREFVSIVRVLKPKFFVMENVLGILTMRNGEAIKDIIHAFKDEGYYIGTPLKLNSMWYGVPQKRKRVFIIGSLDETIKIEQPTMKIDCSKDLFL